MTMVGAPSTLDHRRAEQENLEILTADRPLRTREIFTPNAFYGADAVVKRWARLPQRYRLKIALPHGVAFKMAFYDRREHVPVLTYQWDLHREVLRLVGVTGWLEPMAAPFVYASLMTPDRPERDGTIAFLSRVGSGASAAELERRADELQGLDRALQPVSVCLRWDDVVAGNHLPFARAGVRVVSAGHRSDPDFLYRLVYLFRCHRYLITNGIGSHLFYGIHAGCEYVPAILDELAPAADPASLEPRIRRTAPPELMQAARPLVLRLGDVGPEEQRRAVAPLVGTEHVRAPEEVRRMLLLAELRDKLGIWRPDSSDRRSMALPDVLRRPARGVGRKLAEAVG